jgi:hypothetical protein
MMKNVIFNIEQGGTLSVPKYRVLHPETGLYWNEQTAQWDERGTLYHKLNLVYRVIQNLTRRQYEHLPCVHIVAPVNMTVYSGEAIPVQELIDWLERAARLFTEAKCGNGPRPGTFVAMQIDWADMRKRTYNHERRK